MLLQAAFRFSDEEDGEERSDPPLPAQLLIDKASAAKLNKKSACPVSLRLLRFNQGGPAFSA